MKSGAKLFIWISLLCATLPSWAAASPIRVITTIYPTYEFVRQVGGSLVEVKLLLPPGVEAHSFSPTPRNIVEIMKANLFIYTSASMEPWVTDMMESLQTPTLKIVDLSKMINPKALMAETGTATSTEDHHHLEDPHYWLDPVIAQAMVRAIAKLLIEQQPSHKAEFEKNAQAYIGRLEQLNTTITKSLASCPHRTIAISGHQFFNYFARRYNLKTITAYEGYSPNARPSPDRLVKVVEKLKKDNIKIIFYEAMTKPKMAQVMAEETGARLRPLHTLANLSKEETQTHQDYLSIMKKNLTYLKEALCD